jgi:hypothetical protein
MRVFMRPDHIYLAMTMVKHSTLAAAHLCVQDRLVFVKTLWFGAPLRQRPSRINLARIDATRRRFMAAIDGRVQARSASEAARRFLHGYGPTAPISRDRPPMARLPSDADFVAACA